MKYILSRKSFDSKYGKKPNIITPDETLIPLPIPAGKVSKENFKGEYYDPTEYCNMKIPGNVQLYLKKNQNNDINNYAELMLILFEKYTSDDMQNLKHYLSMSLQSNQNRKPYCCHLDPDLIGENLEREEGWRGLFGPKLDYVPFFMEELRENDLFLFFGTFRHVVIKNGILQYAVKNDGEDLCYKGKHVIYGYLQIRKVITDEQEVEKRTWMYQPYHHPHLNEKLWNDENRAIYVARKHLYLNGKRTNYPGWGMFRFSRDLVLTEPNESKRVWKRELFPKDSIIKRKGKNNKGVIIGQNKWKENGCFEWDTYGQEFVIERCPNFENHVIKNIYKL